MSSQAPTKEVSLETTGMSVYAQLQGKKHLDKLPSTAQSLFHLYLT